MSRVAKAPVEIPNGVNFENKENCVLIKGPKGELKQLINSMVDITKEEQFVNFKPALNHRNAWAQAGTARALINNMVHGVTKGFERTLELVGVGYRSQISGSKVTLNLGFSHPVIYTLPEGVTAEAPSATTLVLKSIDKQLLGKIAAEIRAFRPPEPYKGKGVKYAGEQIMRKEAKKK